LVAALVAEAVGGLALRAQGCPPAFGRRFDAVALVLVLGQPALVVLELYRPDPLDDETNLPLCPSTGK